MKTKITFLLLFICIYSFSQVKMNNNNVFTAKEFSKEIAMYNSKYFLLKDVLITGTEIDKFEVIPLAAASSGELTTLLYKCETKQKEGLILGFYGNYWNEAGILYQGYAFKNLEKEKAVEFLNKISTAIEDNSKFLKDNNDNNNISFTYDEMEVLIWTNLGSYTIRIFWKGFDSTWEKTAYERSKRRFERKIK